MHHSGNELINPFKALERAGLRKGSHIVDLGCGALGHFVFPAAQMTGGEGRVYAVDIDKAALKAVERAARHDQYWNVIPIWSDIDVVNAARIPSGSIDLTVLANNLYLSANRAGMVEEALRLTKPGGRILVIEWKPIKTAIGPPIENRMSATEAKRYFGGNDLDLVDEFDAGDSHFALVYAKQDVARETEVLSTHMPEEMEVADEE
ncbi:class I SAM-dependent methyltransferase [Candidatus Uhrbacteria bacterium]|nr:class I SAM-dependent methyltransferase [Candidatus Uhrbacteria bacterium]